MAGGIIKSKMPSQNLFFETASICN